MEKKIDIEVVLDEQYSEPKVTIHTYTKSEEVENIINAIENAFNESYVSAYIDSSMELVNPKDIFRFRTEGRNVLLDTEEESYVVKKSLSKIEKEMDSKSFVRISQSEIINIYKVKKFDISISGTIGVEFIDGRKSWVSRRFVKQIKNILTELFIK